MSPFSDAYFAVFRLSRRCFGRSSYAEKADVTSSVAAMCVLDALEFLQKTLVKM
jgi:hypothetical protein